MSQLFHAYGYEYPSKWFDLKMGGITMLKFVKLLTLVDLKKFGRTDVVCKTFQKDLASQCSYTRKPTRLHT